MRINRRFLTWGAFFIVLGGVPLAVRAGLLDVDEVRGWWSLWPLIVVGIGVGLVLRRTSFEVLGGLLVAVTAGLMGGAVLAGGAGGLPNAVCGNERAAGTLPAASGTFDGSAAVDLQLDCGELELTGAAGSTWSFRGAGDPARAPALESGAGRLTIRSHESSGLDLVGRRELWQVTVPRDVPLGINLQLNAGRATIAPGAATLRDVQAQVNFGAITLDLGEVTAIESVDIQSNAGTTAVTLPNASMSGRIQVNAGAVRMCAPDGVGLRIRTGESAVSSYDFGRARLVQDGSTWTSPGYDSAGVRIELEAEANAGSFTLNPEDGCDG